MAVFLINICKFNGCGITFPSLGDLIQHIEDTHIDYDPKVIEQKEQAQPTCLPLSYVLRFITDAARKEGPFIGASGAELKRKLAIKHHSYSMSSSNRSTTPTGSELDDDEMIVSESEDSNDSWTTEEFSSEFIMRYGSRHSGSNNGSLANEKPFACPVPGCKKRYKNVNGIKYHSKNGHKKDGKVRKGYKCHCGKSYKTAQGLKTHALAAHNSSPENVNVTSVRSTSPSQSAGSLSPSSISNLSGSSSNCSNAVSNIIAQQISPNSSIITSTSQQNQQNSSNNSNINTSQMRSNIGLISLKAPKSNLVTAGNKILKLVPDPQLDNNNCNKLKFETCSSSVSQSSSSSSSASSSSKISLPGLVNLGILTPATSPKVQQQPQHTFQQQNHLSNNNTNNNCNNNNSNNNNNQGIHDNLPLTPISPNMNGVVTFHSSKGHEKLSTEET